MMFNFLCAYHISDSDHRFNQEVILRTLHNYETSYKFKRLDIIKLTNLLNKKIVLSHKLKVLVDFSYYTLLYTIMLL